MLSGRCIEFIMSEAISFKDIENRYLSEIYKPKARICRIFYFLCFLAATSFCVYILTLLLISFFNYDSYDVTQVVKVTKFPLPAITICNVNTLDAIKMKNAKVKNSNKTVLDAYYDMVAQNKDVDEKNGDGSYKNMDQIPDLHETYGMDLKGMLFAASFAKSDKSNESKIKEFSNITYTELGKCLEMNDNQVFQQQIEGPIGGLTLYLDAKTDYYLGTVPSYGFVVFLRMPNEAVLNKEFGFFVSPGQETFVRVEITNVSRLGEPYGKCRDMDDVFAANNNRLMTAKECFLTQVIHGYLKDTDCRCWPWYYQKR